MSKKLHEYPPLGSPDRLEVIMSQGSSMRRRRRLLGVGGAAVSTLACTLLVIGVLGANAPGRSDAIISADSPNGPSRPTPTTSTAPMSGPASVRSDPSDDPGEMVLEIARKSAQLRIAINDPRTAIAHDSSYTPTGDPNDPLVSSQCVRIDIRDSANVTVGDGFQCRTFGPVTSESLDGPAISSSVGPVEMTIRTDSVIACALVAHRFDNPPQLVEAPQRSRFVADVPSNLQPGKYMVKVTATSGFGDTCSTGIGTSATASTQPEGGAQKEDPVQKVNFAVAEYPLTVN